MRAGREGFLIDSPVYPDELEALPGVLEQAGFPVSGLLASHADWDHLLGRTAFPAAALGCAETTARRLAGEPGVAQRELRSFDEEHYVDERPVLGLGAVQELPVPGHLDLGADHELELHPAPGHTSDGMAVLIPWADVLVCGDYLSPVEIPMLGPGGSLTDYAATLAHLGTLLTRAEWVVPGHGKPLRREQALRLHREDSAYIEALGAGGRELVLPEGRRSRHQRTIHAENLAHLADAGR